uniref:(California timema) hypothetical protein n=1 Tax=Timema californicum TaxID=61474 RepID=A0A7R9JEV7_TIMCA|nr:unnamed protein product [Timema californicum]
MWKKIEAEQESWINRYDSEMDEREVELNLLKNKKAEDYKELEDLALVFHHHQTEIDDYLDIKEVKQQTLAREMLLNCSALLIQDWWRYTMYRKKLGPYKPQKKEKKGVKGKGKKGGKKKKK